MECCSWKHNFWIPSQCQRGLFWQLRWAAKNRPIANSFLMSLVIKHSYPVISRLRYLLWRSKAKSDEICELDYPKKSQKRWNRPKKLRKKLKKYSSSFWGLHWMTWSGRRFENRFGFLRAVTVYFFSAIEMRFLIFKNLTEGPLTVVLDRNFCCLFFRLI